MGEKMGLGRGRERSGMESRRVVAGYDGVAFLGD